MAWHLAASGLVAAMAALLVFQFWYAWPYRVISGGLELFALIVGVDLILGPLITLTIFDVRKPRRELWRDMTAVVCIQLAALAYGVHTVYLARPVALALEGERFRVTAAVEVQRDELPSALPGFQTLSLTGPVLVNTAEPQTPDEQFEFMAKGIAGADLGMRPKLWRPWDEAARARVKRTARPLTELLAKRPMAAADIRAAAQASGRAVAQLLYLPVIAHRSDWSILIDKTSGDPVGFVPVDGF